MEYKGWASLTVEVYFRELLTGVRRENLELNSTPLQWSPKLGQGTRKSLPFSPPTFHTICRRPGGSNQKKWKSITLKAYALKKWFDLTTLIYFNEIHASLANKFHNVFLSQVLRSMRWAVASILYSKPCELKTPQRKSRELIALHLTMLSRLVCVQQNCNICVGSERWCRCCPDCLVSTALTCFSKSNPSSIYCTLAFPKRPD